jgi:phosphoenolpyruvate carboxylase
MATQHPDNARAPYWDKQKRPFISVHQEIHEALACFQDLDVDEFMWDWEGKHADAAVIDRLFSDNYEYFAQQQLGRDKFLTFRIPNIWEERGYSLLQAMTVILTSEDFARDLKYENRPLFEIILPMTERADQLMRMHELFEKLAQFKSADFTPDQPANDDRLELIPLVESVDSQQSVDTLLETYLELYKKHFGSEPEYIRPFLARSDPALVSGLVATVIANKLALTRVYEFSTKTGIPVYPISGVGSLPFRGGLTPSTVQQYLAEYPGMRTVSIQSSFRYDHPEAAVTAALRELEAALPHNKPDMLDAGTQKQLEDIGARAAAIYQPTMTAIAKDVQPFFNAVPKRRDRRQHIGLLAYGRSMGDQKLPRAITFTGGFYSIGVPPEFIGAGRALKALNETELALIRRVYKNLEHDFTQAGAFLNKENLAVLATKNDAWKDVQTDIAALEEVLGVTFGPQSESELQHQRLTSAALLVANDSTAVSGLITEMAELRNSMG